jgi:hypothetical protein
MATVHFVAQNAPKHGHTPPEIWDTPGQRREALQSIATVLQSRHPRWVEKRAYGRTR